MTWSDDRMIKNQCDGMCVQMHNALLKDITMFRNMLIVPLKDKNNDKVTDFLQKR